MEEIGKISEIGKIWDGILKRYRMKLGRFRKPQTPRFRLPHVPRVELGRGKLVSTRKRMASGQELNPGPCEQQPDALAMSYGVTA